MPGRGLETLPRFVFRNYRSRHDGARTAAGVIALSTRHLRGSSSGPEDALSALLRSRAASGRPPDGGAFVALSDVARAAGDPAAPTSSLADRVLGVGDFAPRRESGLLADPASDGLSSLDEGARAASVRAIVRRAAVARERWGAPLVVFRLGAVDVPSREEREWVARTSRDPHAAATFRAEARARADRALEIACRSVHEIVRADEGTTFAVEGPAFGYELGWPEDLARLFSEVKARNLAAWFATGSADLAHGGGVGPDPPAFLEAAAPRLAGVFLSDSDGSREGLVPGRGRVDFRMISYFLPRRAHRVLFLAPGGTLADVDESVAFLADRGIA